MPMQSSPSLRFVSANILHHFIILFRFDPHFFLLIPCILLEYLCTSLVQIVYLVVFFNFVQLFIFLTIVST